MAGAMRRGGIIILTGSVSGWRGAEFRACLLYTSIRKPEADAQRFDSLAILSLVDQRSVAPDRAAEQNELTARMLRLMARILEPIEVRVMTLHYAHEVPLAAITRDLDLRNPSGAKAHIVNARRKLMGLLKRGGWNNCAIGPGFRAVPMRRVG